MLLYYFLDFLASDRLIAIICFIGRFLPPHDATALTMTVAMTVKTLILQGYDGNDSKNDTFVKILIFIFFSKNTKKDITLIKSMFYRHAVITLILQGFFHDGIF